MGLNLSGTRNSRTSCPGLWTLIACQSCTGISWDTAETGRPAGSDQEKLPKALAGEEEKRGDAGGR